MLPRNGAVGTIYLMSGDEDVREGVIEAQELGVSVVLIGIEAVPGRQNQAQTLVREADDLIVLPRSECARFLADSRIATPAAQPSISPARARHAAGASGSANPASSGTNSAAARAILAAEASAFGSQFAATWKAGNDAAALAALLANKPSIPTSLDGPLLRDATAHFGTPLEEPDRRAIRQGFWKELLRT